MSDHENYVAELRARAHADARRAQGNDRAADLTAIRSRAEREPYEYGERYEQSGRFAVWVECEECEDGFYLVEPSEGQRAALRELVQAQHDRQTLLARLDEAEAERDAVVQGSLATVGALNAAVGRIADQRDADRAQMKAARDYLERLPSRTPERDRLITAMTSRLDPARIDELP